MRRLSLGILGIALLAAPACLAAPAAPQPLGDPWKICAGEVQRQEIQHGIPRHLMAAIAKAESGRWDEANRANVAWPWTVTAGGEGRFFATQAEAIAEVKRLKARGVTNIDVGCMQVNLFHHGQHFASIEQAMDPTHNAAYAGRFLKTLRETSADWMEAAGRYHSSTPEKNTPYRAKVARLWDETKRESPNPAPAQKIARASQAGPLAAPAGAPSRVAAGTAIRPPAPRAVVAIDFDRTAQLNANFRARHAPGAVVAGTENGQAAAVSFVGGNPTDAVANRARKDAERVRTLNARAVAPGTSASADRFAAKRANDLNRWRATKPTGGES